MAVETPDNAQLLSRQAAFRILQDVESGALFDRALDRSLSSLPERDRRLAHEISAGVLRHRSELDAALIPLVKASWANVKPELRDVMRIGAYQLLFLERVPRYAAVDSAVELAKRVAGGRSPAMVNAVLRRVSTSEQVAADDETVAGLARAKSHPEWMVERWIRQFGRDETEALLENNNRIPPVIVQPVFGVSDEDLAVRLESEGIAAEPVSGSPGFRLAEAAAAGQAVATGLAVVQDSGQAMLLQAVGLPDNGRILDACAAPGGKLARLGGTLIVAGDRSARRLRRLRVNMRSRQGVTFVRHDMTAAPYRDSSFDCVLVDAPCSGTGALARNPDARWKLSLERVVALSNLQRDILSEASRLVAPGGVLAYLTCSLENEENDLQVADFLRHHTEFSRTDPDTWVLPQFTGTDGGFCARLSRQ